MKATPELLQRALRNLEIGLSPEISAKILATVRLLDEKGAEASLMDFALIEACYSEKIEPQSEPLLSDEIDLGFLEAGDTVEFRNGEIKKVISISLSGGDLFEYMVRMEDFKATFCRNGHYQSKEVQSPDDIVKITKPTKPQ